MHRERVPVPLRTYAPVTLLVLARGLCGAIPSRIWRRRSLRKHTMFRTYDTSLSGRAHTLAATLSTLPPSS